MNYISKLKKYTNKLRYSQLGGANLGVNLGNKGLDTIVMCAQNGFTTEVLPFIHLDRSFDVDKQLWSVMKNVKNPISGKTPLMGACYSGNLTKVNFLLTQGADITLVDQQNKTVLIHAAEHGHISILNRILLQFNNLTGANRIFAINRYVNQTDQINYTALVYACRYGYLDIVNRLIDMSATVKFNQGYIEIDILALFMAVRYNHLAIVTRLLATGAFNQEDKNLILIDACETTHNDMINLLLDPPNNARPTTQRDPFGRGGLTALMAATRNNNLAIVDRLLEYGADVNMDDHYRHTGNTALTIAIQNNNLDIVNRLIDRGARVNIWNNFIETTPLYLAFTHNCSDEIIQRLLTAGANPNLPYQSQSIPMIMDICMNLNDTLENALILGRIIDYFGLQGLVEFNTFGFQVRTSPLITATKLGKERFVNVLLDRGASIDDKDNEGHNAFWYALRNIDEELSDIDIEIATRIYELFI
jgi:ankyrin repeat protein